MPNINAFWPVVHEKIFEDLSKFSLLGLKRGQPLYLNKSESPSPKHVSYQVGLKLACLVVLGSHLQEKLDDRCCSMA